MQTSIASWLRKPAVAVPRITLESERSQASKTPVAQDAEIPKESDAHAVIGHAKERFPGRSPPRPLPPQVSIEPMSAALIPPFRRLNSLLLPIPYQDKFFKETVEDPVIASLTFAALWTSDGAEPRLVGAIRCRLVADQNSSRDPSLYISTIGTLAPYRSHGIANALLDEVVRTAVHEYGIQSVTAHAWAANEEGLEWYAKRGFREVSRQEGYYGRLDPSTAVLIRRDVSIVDALRQSNLQMETFSRIT